MSSSRKFKLEVSKEVPRFIADAKEKFGDKLLETKTLKERAAAFDEKRKSASCSDSPNRSQRQKMKEEEEEPVVVELNRSFALNPELDLQQELVMKTRKRQKVVAVNDRTKKRSVQHSAMNTNSNRLCLSFQDELSDLESDG